MTTSHFIESLKKIGVVLIPVATLAVAWMIAIDPLLGLYDDIVIQNEMLATRLERYITLSQQNQIIADDLQRLKQNLANQDLFYIAANPNAAAALLQQRASEIVIGNGGQMRTAHLEVKAAKSGAQTVSAHLVFAASTPALNNIIFKFEDAKPVIFIDTIAIRSGPMLSSFQNPKTVAGKETPGPNDAVLEIALNLSALTQDKG